MSKIIQTNKTQAIPFLRILSSQSVYFQILEELKKEQKEVLMMCQSHNEYQVMKEEMKKRISKGNPITTLAIVSVIKTILTETKHSLMNFEGLFEQKSTDSPRKSLQNPQNTLSTQTQNPYSHILCFRLLKYAITKGDYGMLSLIVTDLSELIYDVVIFDHKNENLQRGRGLYLQNYNLSNNQKSLPMTFDEMEHIGYSVHTFSLETMFVLGNQIKFLPYHQNFIKQNQTKNSNGKPLKQNKKIFGQYSSELLESKCHKMYAKTKQIKVKYGQTLHYFKNQEIQKLHRNSFNSEQIPPQIKEFYEFMFGLTIIRQVHINDKIIKTINDFDEGQFGNFYRRYLKKPSVNAFLLTLKQIMHTNDRYCLYFTIILINETLKFIESIEGEKKEIIFYSICEILDQLILKIRNQEDETEDNSRVLQLKEFNYEMYQALDKVIGYELFNMHENIFATIKGKTEKRSYFHQYAKKYFNYFLLKVQKVFNAINQSMKKQNTLKIPGVQDENSFFAHKKNTLSKFEKQENFGIKNMNASFSQYRLLRRLDCLKANFPIPLESIQSKNLRIHKDTLRCLKDQQKLLSNDSIIKQAKIECKVDIPPQKNQNNEYHYITSIDAIIEASSRERNSQYLSQSDDDIPMQAVDVVKTVDSYQLRKKDNDISKINIKRTKTTRTTKITDRTEFTLRDSSSIRETLRRGTIKMNLADRDIQALKTNNQNKYKRKQSNSRLNSQARGFETVLQPLSSPTFGDQLQVDEVIQQINATYKDLLSQKTFNKKSNQEKVDNFLTPYQQLKSGQIRAIIDMMRVRNGYPSKLHNEKPFTFQPQRPVRVGHLVTPYPNYDLMNVKNTMTNEKEDIFNEVDEFGLEQQSFGRYEKEKTQDISDLMNNQSQLETIPADSFLAAFLPKNNKQTKSKFYHSSQRPENKKCFQHLPVPSNTSIQQPISPTFKVSKKSFDSRSKIQPQITIFAFPVKMKRQMLKKKVLLTKDEFIEIGMITQLEVPVKQIPFLNQKIKQTKTTALQPKLKATLYVTSLSKQTQQIQVNSQCPSWISSRILQNKLKQITKANSQYTITIEFSLQNIQQPKSDLQKVPSLHIALRKKANQKPYKNYELQLPLFLNKFFSEQLVNEDQMRMMNNKIKLANVIWLDVSSRLIKEYTELGKYFSKLKPCDQQVSITKVKFLQENIYLCFRNNIKNRNSQESTKSILKPLSFVILHENEIEEIDSIQQLNSEKNCQIYDLMLSTFMSLLGE